MGKAKELIENEKRRFMVQVFALDNEKENPVLESFGMLCFDAESTHLLFETMQRVSQVLTYKLPE